MNTQSPPRSAHRSPCSHALRLATFAAVLCLVEPRSSAAVFRWEAQWPQSTAGFTVIPVCIVEGSSNEQLAPWYILPGLDQTIQHIQAALRTSWERSSIRFTGWQSCAALSAEQRLATVGLYIHWDAPNNAKIGGKGLTTATDPTIQFKPWGYSCLAWDWGAATYRYRWACVEQYAIHEFGHIIGLEHEWMHPLTPASCSGRPPDEQPLSPARLSDVPIDRFYYIPNRDQYDWSSIMTYDDNCAHVNGERFGSPAPSPADMQAVLKAYSPNVSNTVFQSGIYITLHPDVRAAYGDNAVEHYLNHGHKEGRTASTSFDPRFYLQKYPDLAAAFGQDHARAVQHWTQYGISEGRQGSAIFDPVYYLSSNPDIAAAGGATNFAFAHRHWIESGIREGRRGSREYDARYYLEANPDVARVFGETNYLGAMIHWIGWGVPEGRAGAR